ncbi:Hint domain-containing protein [Antarcticimicrobium luteum]|nr:Hint domain-containing protein [Antarcticimicrobium luteum]
MLRLLKALIGAGTQPEDPEITPEGMVITGLAGLLGGTLVATDQGWCPAETIRLGDRLLSFDRGMQAVTELQRERPRGHSGHPAALLRAVEVPTGALGNDAPLWLMPDQGVLLESDKAQEILGDPFAVVPARALLGINGIRLSVPGSGISITTLAFPHDETIYIDGGLRLFCPRPRTVLTEALGPSDGGVFSVQTLQTARFLVRTLIETRGAGALCAPPEEIAGQMPLDPRGVRPLAG